MGTKAYTARKIGLETNGDSFKELSAAKAGCAPLSSDKAIKIFKKGRFQVTAEFLHKLGGQSNFFALIPNLYSFFPNRMRLRVIMRQTGAKNLFRWIGENEYQIRN